MENDSTLQSKHLSICTEEMTSAMSECADETTLVCNTLWFCNDGRTYECSGTAGGTIKISTTTGK